MDTKITRNINREELEKTPSFRDLSAENRDLDDQSLTFHHSPNTPSHGHESFGFSFFSDNNKNDVVLCGKHVEERDVRGDEEEEEEQGRNVFSVSSFRQFDSNKKDSASLSTKSFRSQSSKVKQHKSLIGVTKIPQRMELGDLKKRQSRTNHPLFMFPPVADGDMAMVDAGDGCSDGGKKCMLKYLKP
ncbi:hypothetical protein HRI_002154400 [Hibiscus trionum]|uniref:Uncharacterized protein n=1 Tax=Hibiscus trionum TaxID=183268 RepID=A0A9W7HXH0_HIBTR|nr:hypothetical protein HRI_002154400 [Hibiscus trionum]